MNPELLFLATNPHLTNKVPRKRLPPILGNGITIYYHCNYQPATDIFGLPREWIKMLITAANIPNTYDPENIKQFQMFCFRENNYRAGSYQIIIYQGWAIINSILVTLP